MKRFVVTVAAILSLCATPAFAASPEAAAAAKAISDISADATKREAYCKIIKDMEAAGEDEAKLDALGEQLEELLQSFGPQVQQAMEISEEAGADSEDAQAIEAAFESLDESCEG